MSRRFRRAVVLPVCVAVMIWAAVTTGAVTASGATVQEVRYSQEYLVSAMDYLDSGPHVPGTAWAVDQAANRVVLRYDETVAKSRMAELESLVRPFGPAIQLQPMAGRLSTYMRGGYQIYDERVARCTLGFNAVGHGAHYIITAGHCTRGHEHWWANSLLSAYLGHEVSSRFPGDDIGIIRYDENTTAIKEGVVHLYRGSEYQDIQTARGVRYHPQYPNDPRYTDTFVCKSGSTTRLTCGKVTNVGATVAYPQGTVYGLIQTNVCAEPGDSGAPLYSGIAALGVLSGGFGNCDGGGAVIYFQPVPEIQNIYGIQVF